MLCIENRHKVQPLIQKVLEDRDLIRRHDLQGKGRQSR